MTHKSIKKRLLLYIDGDLSDRESLEVKDHLSHCSSCEKEMKLLSSVWINKNTTERVPAPEYLWTKINTGTKEFINKDLIHPVVKLVPALRLVLLFILLISAVFLGNYIGRIYTDDLPTANEQYFWTSYNLDFLEPVPTESIGKIFPVVVNSQGEEIRK